MENTVFDVAAFEAADTAILDVLDQRGDPLMFNGHPVQIELYGPGSEQAMVAQAKIDQALQTIAYKAAMAAGKGKTPADSGDETRRLQVGKLVAHTKTLINFPILGGAQELYTNRRLAYITKQVEQFIGNWANFPAACTRN